MRDPRPGPEIRIGERGAAPVPGIRRAAEVPVPRIPVPWEPDVLERVQLLGAFLEVEAAGLQQQDGGLPPEELPRDGDPGGAGADDAEL